MGCRMNFKSYAISQKIRNGSNLIEYLHSDSVPREVLEKEFLPMFELYKDDEAELLANSYSDYLTEYVPVTFKPNANGINVSGYINDNVMDVIESVHKVKREDAVKELVSNTVTTVNPNRHFNVLDIEFTEQLIKNQHLLDNIITKESVVKEQPKKDTVEKIEEVKVENNNDFINEIKTSENNNVTNVVNDIVDEVKEETEELKYKDDEVKKALTEIYNKFLAGLNDVKISERTKLDTSLNLAI